MGHQWKVHTIATSINWRNKEGVWIGGEAGIGEDLVDSLIDTIGWAGKQIYSGNGFFPLIFLEESGWSP